MWNLNCTVFILFLSWTVIASREKPDCTKKMADVVIMLENSNKLSSSGFESMKKEVTNFLNKMTLGTDDGEIRVTLASFGHKIDYIGEWETDASKLTDGISKLTHQQSHEPDMTLAIKTAKDKLFEDARKGVLRMVLYVGSGKNSQSDDSLRPFLVGIEIPVFGVVKIKGDNEGRPDERLENLLSLFELWSIPGTNDMMLGIQEFLNPLCSQCLRSIVDMAVLVEDVPSTVDTVPDPTYPMNWYPIMLNGLLIKAMKKIRVFYQTTRVAVVSYGDEIYESQTFNFTTYRKRKPLIERLKTFKYMNSKTQDVHRALKYTMNNLFTPENSRQDSTKIIVLITHYPAVEKVSPLAKEIRDKGIHIFEAGWEYTPWPINKITGSSFARLDGQGITYQNNQLFWYTRDLVRKTCIMGKFLD